MPVPRGVLFLAVVLLAAPLQHLTLPSAAQANTPDGFTPLAGLEGPRDTLRLYGCTDAVQDTERPRLATDHAGEDPPRTGAPDGRPDCGGDRVHLGMAWMASAQDPFHREALGPRDQVVGLDLSYRPVAWQPGPQQQGGVSGLVDPSKGFFDLDADGLLDTERPPDAPRDDEGRPLAVDRQFPRDRLPDHAERSTGPNGADLYFPAVAATYRYAWTMADAPTHLPHGAAFLFPTASSGSVPGLDTQVIRDAPAPVHWHARPFGVGSGSDGLGALHTPPITLRAGETAHFLDHSVRVTGFFGSADAPRVGLEVRYHGGSGTELLEGSLVLGSGREEDGRRLTLDGGSASPLNAVFSDRSGIDRDLPPFGDPTDPRADAAWFALVDEVVAPSDGAGGSASIRLGRMVSAAAPLNAFVVDRVLYHVSALEESSAGLHRFHLASIHPIGQDMTIAASALTLAGWRSSDKLPLLPPFDRTHQTLADLDPALGRTSGGFLAEAGNGNGIIGTGEVALRPAAASAAERAHARDALTVQYRASGYESRLSVPLVSFDSDTRLSYSQILPARWLEIVLPDGRYRVDSVLLHDGDTLTDAADAPASPRGFRSFVFDPKGTEPLFADADGLRVFGRTAARPDAGDLVRLDPAVLRWDDHGGRIRTPDRLAHEAIGLSVGYDPYTWFGDPGTLTPFNGTGPLVDGEEGPHDNLWDVRAAVGNTTSGVSYGPALHVSYHARFLDRTTFEGLAPVLGARTALLLPAADRDGSRAGLDSFDMDGDGIPDEVVLRGFWDLSGTGAARDRLRTGGTAFVAEGNASTADLLWLQSRPLVLPVGGEGQFFDHGIRYLGRAAEGSGGRFELLDARSTGRMTTSGGPAVVSPDANACWTVRWDGAPGDLISCGDVRVTPATAGVSPQTADHMWWLEVQAVSDDAATVLLNRVITPVDRDPAGDQSRMVASGQLYAWEDVRILDARGDQPGDRFHSLTLSHIVPLEHDLPVPVHDGAVTVLGVPAGARVPLLPPFAHDHEILRLHQVDVETGETGFLDSRGIPGDGDAVLIPREQRTERVGPVVIDHQALGRAAQHHFVLLDPTREWDPARAVGTAFVHGQFADPSDGAPVTAEIPRLKPAGADGFPEAISTHADRGWDHYARITLQGRNGIVVDSARLGHPGLTAEVRDLGVGTPAGAAQAGLHPNDPLLVPEAPTRGSGLWAYTQGAPDPYIGHLEGKDTVQPPPSPSPTVVPDRSPPPASPWPTRTAEKNETNDNPGPLWSLLLAAVAVGAVVAARSRRMR